MLHARAQCAACNQTFAGTKAFDAHRVGPYTRKQQRRRCLSRKEMRLRGMTQNEQGWWMLPARARADTSEEETFSSNQASECVEVLTVPNCTELPVSIQRRKL